MIINKPYFYDSFKCTADKCRDSCCIGWEIDIDSESLERFKNEKGELGKKLSDNIDTSSFILTEDERCPFLTSKGLCELIIRKDQDYICEICREHPRYHEWYGDHHDMGLGLCCEEACRLLFQNDERLYFITEKNNELGDGENDMITSLLSEREKIFKTVTDRGLPLSQRLQIDITLKEVVNVWDSLEPFDKRWIDTSKYIKENFDKIIAKRAEFLSYIGKRVYEYEHLAVYLIHRYFMKSVYKYFPDSVVYGIGIYLGTQFLFDLCRYATTEKFDFADRIDNAKYISKQLEYSEENIDIIMDR